MAEAVVLGDLELDRVTGITMEESRKLAVHPWPGAAGDLIQDMGLGAARIWLSGVAAGEESARRLEQVRAAMQEGKPLDFTASVAVASRVEQVVVAGLKAVQPPGRTNYYEYQLALVQYVQPPPPIAGDFDMGALAEIDLEAGAAALESMTGALEEAGALQEAVASLEDAMSAIDTAGKSLSEVAGLVGDALAAVEGLGSLAKILGAAGQVVEAAADA